MRKVEFERELKKALTTKHDRSRTLWHLIEMNGFLINCKIARSDVSGYLEILTLRSKYVNELFSITKIS